MRDSARCAGGAGDARVVVVGSGLAGLATALSLAPLPVLLVTAGRLGAAGSSALAQGGLAAAVGAEDSPALHAADTLAAAAGLAEPTIVAAVTQAAPAAVSRLRDWGLAFDLDDAGGPALTLEGGHGRRRVLHAGGDRTGAAAVRALAAQVRAAPWIAVAEETRLRELLCAEGEVVGALLERDGAATALPARAVVLATGGAGALYAATTNPPSSWGSGLWLAARAGARLRDLEFVQFHPTAIALPELARRGAALPLASEALRGEGAVLRDETGAPVMADDPAGDLAPRDRVARGIWRRLQAGGRVFLDARAALGPRFPARFPGITALCRAAGLDPVRQPIPVRPAAHYHMGGVQTDARGATSLPGLWAVGEVASTGLHGANRLASNSLLEAVVFAGGAAEDIRSREAARTRLRPAAFGARLEAPAEAQVGAQVGAQLGAPGVDEAAAILRLRRLMEARVGVLRDRAGLESALGALDGLRASAGGRLAAMAEVGRLIAAAALTRRESRGAHARSDWPDPDPAWARHQSCASDASLPAPDPSASPSSRPPEAAAAIERFA